MSALNMAPLSITMKVAHLGLAFEQFRMWTAEGSCDSIDASLTQGSSVRPRCGTLAVPGGLFSGPVLHWGLQAILTVAQMRLSICGTMITTKIPIGH